MSLRVVSWMAVVALLCAGVGVAAAPPEKSAPPAKSAAPQKSAKPAKASKSETKAEADGKEAESKEAEDPHSQLDYALSETGGSPADIAALLEKHLKTHEGCDKRREMTRVLAQLAVELKDRRRILLYGPQAIDDGAADARLLEGVVRTLLDGDDAATRARALKYAAAYVALTRAERDRLAAIKEPAPGQGRRYQEVEIGFAQALVYQARAQLAAGDAQAAVKSANEGWALVAMAELAMERSRAYEALGQFAEALEAASEAFVVEDGRATAQLRQTARERMTALGAKAQLDPASKVLSGWDRTRAIITARADRLRAYEPNLAATSPLDYTVGKVDGTKLALASMKGKVVVFDFWATWCGPCRVQHPLYEQAKERFKSNSNVVFLAVATDEDRTLVKPFLEKNKWSQDVLFDDGLAGYFRVSSIPTTIVLNKRGELASRMPGFIADRFVDMLSERIESALADN